MIYVKISKVQVLSNRELPAFCLKNPPKYAYWRKITFFKLEASQLFVVIFDFLDFKYKAPREMDQKTHRKSSKTTFLGTLHDFGPRGLCLV